VQLLVHGAERAAGQPGDVLQAQIGAVAQGEHLAHVGFEPVERSRQTPPQQRLCLRALPQGHGSLRPTFAAIRGPP